MKIAILDNYDSFTYNLVHLVNSIYADCVDVYMNDISDIEVFRDYQGIILSPGPGVPDDAGILKDVIRFYAASKPLFGVCLGMQAVAEVFGGSLRNLPGVFYGVDTEVIQTGNRHRLFKDMPGKFLAGRYHSWIVSRERLPDCLDITAVDSDGEIMALAHREYDICGVQFHPESILTPCGKQILENWMDF